MANFNSVWVGYNGGTNGGFPFTGQMVGPAANNTAAPPFTFLGDLTSGYGSSAVGTLDLVTAGTSRLAINSTSATFANGVVGSFSRNGIVSTSTDGLLLSNSTAALVGVQVQQSPRERFRANGWNTGSVATNTLDLWWENIPIAGNPPVSVMTLGSSVNGGAATFPFSVTSDGSAVFTGFLQAGTYLSLNQLGSIRGTATDGTFNFFNNAQSAGVGINIATDTILKIRNTAQTGGAAMELLERTAPAAGAADTVRIYAQDNGGGKTQLMAIFASGAAQQIAIQP